MPRHRSLARKSYKVQGTGDGGKPRPDLLGLCGAGEVNPLPTGDS